MTTGELIGFSDIGDINQHLIQLEKQSLDLKYTKKLHVNIYVSIYDRRVVYKPNISICIISYIKSNW